MQLPGITWCQSQEAGYPALRVNSSENLSDLCRDCHDAVHCFFSNKELERQYNSIEAMMAREAFAKHIRWIARRDPGDRQRTIMNNKQRGRGRNG